MIYICDRQYIRPSEMGAYKEMVVKDLIPIMAGYGADCYGFFRAWRSNEFWIFWEVKGGFESADEIDRAMVEDKDLVKYEEAADRIRTNYDSRILKPVKFSRDIATLKKLGIKGDLYSFTNTPVEPAKFDEWLRLFESRGMKHETETGLHTVGYFWGGIGEVMKKQLCYITQLVCVDNWAARDNYPKAFQSIPEIQEWWGITFNYRGHHSTSEMLPIYLPY